MREKEMRALYETERFLIQMISAFSRTLEMSLSNSLAFLQTNTSSFHFTTAALRLFLSRKRERKENVKRRCKIDMSRE